MHVFAPIVGVLVILGVVLDAFQTIILPRRPKGRFRITRLFYFVTWSPFRFLVDHIPSKSAREQAFSIFGPMSLLLLLGVWATLLCAGFACIFFGVGTPFKDALNPAGMLLPDIRTDIYVSGTTLFTLGLGDVVPMTHTARFLLVLESGTGLGFVALVIGYLPVLYQAFSRREVSVALLDSRAGSPPTAAELLRRHSHPGGDADLITLLIEWERWSAELLESHVSYPLLCYYRSQHDNQSWLAALVAVLDACALIITTVEGQSVRQAQLTFAMARHALVDLNHIFQIAESHTHMQDAPDRLPPEQFHALCSSLGEVHLRLCGDPASLERLTAIRTLYEPHALALCQFLRLGLPLWAAEPKKKADAWKKVADLRRFAERSDDALMAGQHVSESALTANLLGEEHGIGR